MNFLYFRKAEELAFLWLFPYAIGGFDENRIKKLTLSQYYKIRLYSGAGTWCKNITYLMHAVNTLEKSYLLQLIGVYKGNDGSSPLFTADVRNYNTSILAENSYMFMKKN